MDAQQPLEIAVEAAPYDSLYEHIVRPERAVYPSEYFKRWIKHIGPDLAWMYIAFRQSAYLRGGREGEHAARLSGVELSRRCGISERTFWNRVKSEVTWRRLKGLAEQVEEEKLWEPSAALPKRLAKKFIVAMTLPLTPSDTHSLTCWLDERFRKTGSAEQALRDALRAPLSELIPEDAEDQSEPLTARELTRALFEGQADPKLIDALSAALHNHLMPPHKQIKITVFFLEHILPHLGAGPGWLVTLLRDRCYDSELETRNRVVVKRGYQELASWLGIARVKTVWEWLHMNKKDGTPFNAVLRAYLRELEGERDPSKFDRVFQVLLEEVPAEMVEAFACGRGALFDLASGVERGSAAKTYAARLGGNCSIGLAEFAYSLGGVFSIGMAEFAYRLGGIFSIGLADFADRLGGSCTVKSSLSPLTQLLNPPTQPAQTQTAQPAPAQTELAPAPAGGRAGWDFSHLTQNLALNAKTRSELARRFPDAQDLSRKLLAWVLYAHSPQGRGLTDASGVSKAVKSLCAAQPELAPEKFARLATLGERGLRDLFDRDYARAELGKSAEANTYRANFAKLDAERKSALYFALFGQPNPEPAPRSPAQKSTLQIRLEQRQKAIVKTPPAEIEFPPHRAV